MYIRYTYVFHIRPTVLNELLFVLGLRQAAAQIIQDSEENTGRTIVGSLLNLTVMLLSFLILY